MPLIVENGAGLATAESYVSVADCMAYAQAHGLAFAGQEPAQEAALRNATIYLDGRYTFRGYRKTSEQALAWPRCRVDAEGVPREVVSACCELATRAIAGSLWQDVAAGDPGAVTEETVGPITTTYAAPTGARLDGQTEYAGVTAMLRRWIGSTSMMKLARA